jgi:hypothetical protein
VTFDLGRFGEQLESLRAEPGFGVGAGEVARRSGREAAFESTDEPFVQTRVVQVGGRPGPRLHERGDNERRA